VLSYIYSLATDKRKGPVASVIKSFLFSLSLIYGLIIRALIFIYFLKPRRLRCKVISVGNITLGGTGKTPLVEAIARFLKENGHKVAILTRGYKRKLTAYSLQLTAGQAIGDEPYMLKNNLKDVPVLVDSDRIRAAGLAIRDYGVDTVILDDGMQQWRIKKDLEAVTIDATCPLGNRKLIPRGILREPLSSLKRADILVWTKTNLCPQERKVKDLLSRINPRALHIESVHTPLGLCRLDKPDELLGVDILQGEAVTLFSAIGDPHSFECIVRNLGIKVGLSFKFRDHHNYTKEDLNNIISKSKEMNIGTLLTTEKDAARLYELRVASYELRLLFLRIELRITKDEEGFYSRLLGLYSY